MFFRRLLLPGLVVVAMVQPPAVAQGLLVRSPNLPGPWVGAPGMLYFNFLHRFTAGPAPERKVANSPTFLLAGALPWHTLLGVYYATSSELTPRYPNEWELFGRIQALAQASGAPLDAGAEIGYNLAARGLGAEISAARSEGPVRMLGALRALKDPDGGGADVALAAGAVLRLTPHLSVAGDVADLTRRNPGERVAWSAGLNITIPGTPHGLSLHVTNANNVTLESASRGTATTRYGFEFTIPITLARYFGGRPDRPEASASPPRSVHPPASRGTVGSRATVEDFAFRPGRLQIQAGTTVL